MPEIENSSLHQATILTMVLHNIRRDLKVAVSNGARNLYLVNIMGPEINYSSLKRALWLNNSDMPKILGAN